MPLLEVRGLQKSFSGRRVVDGVDFHVGRGEIVGLLGPNGAGKTTTFRMVMGMIPSEAGVVKLGADDISGLPMYQRARRGLGYLSQEPSIFRNLSVEDNVLAILETQPIDRRERRERLAELLSDLGLSRLSANIAYTLSGGERRRLEIARALVTHPQILLLDEPFSGVDPRACEEIQKIVSSLSQRGMSILLTDHNVFETFTIVDRAYIIRDGRVLKHGTPDELVNDQEARRLYLGDKFTEYGEAFSRLREEIERKGKAHTAVNIGRTTRILRLEEEEHRRKQLAPTSDGPHVQSVQPDRGPLAGGTAVVIAGVHFGEAVEVAFDGVPATEVAVSTGTRITCRTPAGKAPGPVAVTVTVAGTGAVARLERGYSYV